MGAAFVSLYEQLRRIARARLAGVDGGSLQATAMVHEALLKLVGRPLNSFKDEQHLLGTAAQAIRQVIIDHLRAKRAAKRDGSRTERLSSMSSELAALVESCDGERLAMALDIDAALSEVAEVDPELRTIVDLHVYGGFPLSEIGALVGCSERTVHRRWAYAAALLRERLDEWVRAGRSRAGEESISKIDD